MDDLGPLVGRTFGSYEITSYIGEGPTGSVTIAPKISSGPAWPSRSCTAELARKDTDALWSRSSEALVAEPQPQVLKTYDAGFDEDGQFYYVMDELVGCDLETGLEESGALAPQEGARDRASNLCGARSGARASAWSTAGSSRATCSSVRRPRASVDKVLDFGAARLAGGVDKGVIVRESVLHGAGAICGGQADAHTDAIRSA